MRIFVPAVAILALASSCTLNTDYFSEYRGVNLLSNYDFDALEGDAVTPKWSMTTTTDYMLWAPATDLSGIGDGSVSTLDLGPDGVSPAYRLEIKNLVPDGDFEAEGEIPLSASLPGSLVATGWSSKSGTPKYRISEAHADNGAGQAFVSGSETIDNRSLLFSAQGAGQQLSLSLETALGARWLAGSYRIRFDFVNGGTGTDLGLKLVAASGVFLNQTQAQGSGAWDQHDLDQVDNASPERYSVSKTFEVEADTDVRELLIGASTGGANAALIDNVRVLVANGDLSATAKLTTLTSGALPLLPGTKSGAYTFSIQVHDDPTADQEGGSGIAHTGNRFYPSGLTVTILGRSKNKSDAVLVHEFIPRPAGGWPTWTAVTLQGGLDFVEHDEDREGSPALTLSLSPTNAKDVSTDGKDVGSLLISQPKLTFNP